MNTSTTFHPPALLRRSIGGVHRKADPLAGQVLADGLRVSAPSDPLEREAEATASRVMRTQAPAKPGGASVRELRRVCHAGNLDQAIHRKPTSVARAPAAIASRGGPGSALPDGVRTDMEGRFGGQDFSGVRVHAGPQANTLARSYNARAFTTGSDVYFGQGEYSPSSKGGQHLLAHELTHVLQGQRSTASRTIARQRAAQAPGEQPSRRWAIKPVLSGSIVGGAGVSGLYANIKNKTSGQTRDGYFVGLAAGAGEPVTVQTSIQPSWTDFTSLGACTLSDFDGTTCILASGSLGLGLGYSATIMSLPLIGPDLINMSGWTAGAVLASGAVAVGTFCLGGASS